MQFVVGSRVQRIGKSWGNIRSGAIGEVKEVIDFGKKLRVLFDDYTSDREDGTVIVMAKSMGLAPFRVDRVTAVKVMLEEGRIAVDKAAPIRDDPFRGVRTHRVSATESISTKKIGRVKVVSVEHVDLTVPFHKQLPGRPPDWMQMSDYSDSCEIEGLVGEGYDEDIQEDLAQRIDRQLERAAAAPRQEMSARARIRPMLPYTAWELEMRKRRFRADDLVLTETLGRVDGSPVGCLQEREEALRVAMDVTLRYCPLPK